MDMQRMEGYRSSAVREDYFNLASTLWVKGAVPGYVLYSVLWSMGCYTELNLENKSSKVFICGKRENEKIRS